jgi:hypothetical protein
MKSPQKQDAVSYFEMTFLDYFEVYLSQFRVIHGCLDISRIFYCIIEPKISENILKSVKIWQIKV